RNWEKAHKAGPCCIVLPEHGIATSTFQCGIVPIAGPPTCHRYLVETGSCEEAPARTISYTPRRPKRGRRVPACSERIERLRCPLIVARAVLRLGICKRISFRDDYRTRIS